jgi:hypothetical protein
MKRRKASRQPRLTGRQVAYRVFRRLKKYDKLTGASVINCWRDRTKDFGKNGL